MIKKPIIFLTKKINYSNYGYKKYKDYDGKFLIKEI